MNSFGKHSALIDSAIARDEAARVPLVASWQRSRVLHDLHPDKAKVPDRVTETQLNEAQEELGLLLNLSNPNLDQLYSAVGSVGCSVVLANKNGVAIARRGAKEDDFTFNKWGLWTGAVWSEESEGTNGIGTCIVEKRPLTIHKEQHFHAKNKGLSCTAAPIFDHKGNLIAVIDVSSCRADLTADFSKLISVAVTQTARRIETEHFSKRFPNAQIILAPEPIKTDPTAKPARGASLFAVDGNDLIIGATRTARDTYDLSDADMNQLLTLPELQGKDVDLAKDYALSDIRIIQKSLAKFGGNVSAAAREMGISRSTLHRKMNRIRKHES